MSGFNIRFPGQYYDAETGLHYNRYRYYDPTIGRYASADPIGQAGGVNLYGYAGNNPLSFFDFLALDPVVTFTERGGPGQNSTPNAFGADITVVESDTGEVLFEGRGSTLPNDQPGANFPTTAEGSFPAANTTMTTPDADGNPRPGLFLQGPVSSTEGNPLSEIFAHCADSAMNRGSQACLTVAPPDCDAFFALFGAEQRGITVNVSRPPSP